MKSISNSLLESEPTKTSLSAPPQMQQALIALQNRQILNEDTDDLEEDYEDYLGEEPDTEKEPDAEDYEDYLDGESDTEDYEDDDNIENSEDYEDYLGEELDTEDYENSEEPDVADYEDYLDEESDAESYEDLEESDLEEESDVADYEDYLDEESDLDGYNDTDNLEELDNVTNIEQPKKIIQTSAPLLPPGFNSKPVSTLSRPLLPPGSNFNKKNDMNLSNKIEEQTANFSDIKSQTNVVIKKEEKVEVDDRNLENCEYRGQNFDNFLEKPQPTSETSIEAENLGYVQEEDYAMGEDEYVEDAQVDDYVVENDDYVVEEEEDSEDNYNSNDTEFDQSLIDSIPLIEESATDAKQTELLNLEAENESLKIQLAEIENAKLKKQLSELKNQNQNKEQALNAESLKTEPIKLNKGLITNSKKEQISAQPIKAQSEEDKHKEQIKRWAKYAAMTTNDLWNLVYKFMTIAGVANKPVKAQILFAEFGTQNIKRLESSYLMKTKDGYTC